MLARMAHKQRSSPYGRVEAHKAISCDAGVVVEERGVAVSRRSLALRHGVRIEDEMRGLKSFKHASAYGERAIGPQAAHFGQV